MGTSLTSFRMLQPTKRRPNDPLLAAGRGSGSPKALPAVGPGAPCACPPVMGRGSLARRHDYLAIRRGSRGLDRPRGDRVGGLVHVDGSAVGHIVSPIQGVHAYLDDSIREPIAVCAGVVVDADRVEEAEAELRRAKELGGVDPAIRIHCRTMFPPDARREGPWARFTDDEIRPFVSRVCFIMRRVIRETLVVAVPTEAAIFPPDGGASGSKQDPKGVASFAYSMLMAHLRNIYPDAGLRVWIDRETTKIPWGGKRRQAQNTRYAVVELSRGADLATVVPEPMMGELSPLLEVADVLAYAKLQVEVGRRDSLGEWAARLLDFMRPRSGVYVSPPGGPGWIETTSFGQYPLPKPEREEDGRLVVLANLPREHPLYPDPSAIRETPARPRGPDGQVGESGQ